MAKDPSDDELARTDSLKTKTRGVVYDSWEPDFFQEVADALRDRKPALIYDYPTRRYLTLEPEEIDYSSDILLQVRRILQQCGVVGRRSRTERWSR
jgi:hypothetical protein